jgi:beta-galactosidase
MATHEKEAVCTELVTMFRFSQSMTAQSMIEGTQRSPGWRRMLAGLILLLALLTAPGGHAQSATTIRIDASQPYSEPGAAPFDGGSARSPSGSVLGVNSRYLTLDGKPWLPVMGEFHFSRYPRAQWEEEILKMKAAGVNIVATYVIWIHHEEIEGQFDWMGQRDLHAFTQLCAKHGMYVLVRIGPWDHGEVRNGGFPDWVMKKSPTRVNDPVYLAEVRTWYGQIAQQVNGLLWKDGGPVLGIQLENEYSQRGPGAGEEHILELKKIAVESGFDVPLYVVTGWDNAVVPLGAVLPFYGGYPDAPWDGSLGKIPPQEVYAFRFQNRVSASLHASDAQVSAASTRPDLTAELGGGNEITYHRRPVIEADDIAAMFSVMLGSGVNLYGTYMFHGGENPDGKLTTLQESQATGYPNDVPVKSYDFQAPLSEFGEERASFRKMKVFQYFLNDFGAELAPMTVHTPDALPKSVDDFTVPRASVRSHGDAGFIFFNNYVRNYSMPVRQAAQFEIQLPGGPLMVPRHPVEIPSGAYFIWPFNLRVDGVSLRYSTAQLFTRLQSGGVNTLYFEAVRGIPAEFVFDAASLRTVHASSGETTNDSGAISISGVKPGADSSIDLVSSDGARVRIVLLTAEEAENAWKVRFGGEEHLLISRQDFFADSDVTPGRIWLRSRGAPEFAFSIAPPLDHLPEASLTLTKTASNPDVVSFTAEAATHKLDLKTVQLHTAGDAPPVRTGSVPKWRPRGVALAPDDAAFAQAATWSLTVPPGAMQDLADLFLEVDYEGDVARLSAEHELLTDDFYNGHPWFVGLSRFLHPGSASTFELSILPLRKDAPVYFELPKPVIFPENDQADRLNSVKLVPEYQLILSTGPGR